MRQIRVVLAWASLAILAHAACGAAQTPIVVNNPAPNPNAPAFRISAQPVVKLGGLNDDARYEFNAISQVDITETGRLIVLPVRGVELRVFDLRGQHQRNLGRRGQGPGEFIQAVQIKALDGDTLAVYDNIQQRLTIFNAATGAVLRSIPEAPQALCCFPDASSLIRPGTVRALFEGPLSRFEVTATAPDTNVWALLSGRVGGTPQPAVLTTRGNDPEIRLGRFADPVKPGEGPSWTLPTALPPFARTAYVAIAGNEIVYGVSERFEYNVYSKLGVHLRSVRAVAPPVTATRTDIAEAHKVFMSGADTPEKVIAFEEHYSKLKLYTTLPAFGRILAEGDGTVWIQNYMRPGTTTQWWAKFDSSGKLVGTLSIPAGMNVRRFAHGYVLFVPSVQQDGVATLFVHRIEPTAR